MLLRENVLCAKTLCWDVNQGIFASRMVGIFFFFNNLFILSFYLPGLFRLPYLTRSDVESVSRTVFYRT